MEAVLLSVHVLAGIVFVGGSAIAASLFPRYAPVAAGTAPPSEERNRGYGIFGLVVPVVGIALALVQGRMSEIWLNISMVLTFAAGGVLALQIYPRQRDALARPGDEKGLRRLSMLAGIYNLLWAVVVVLMIVRPGG
jgi:Na+/proline symporter